MVDNDLLGKLEEMAGNDDWRVREAAADQIRDLNDRYFDDYYPVWQEWVKDENHFLRRAAEVGLTRIAPSRYEQAWKLLEPLLYDENIYVRKSCGPVALNVVASRNPQESFKRFRELARSQQNRNVLWNLAAACGQSIGLEHPEESLNLLHDLARDERRFVWRGAAAALVRLIRQQPRYKHQVFGWTDVKQAVAVVKKYTEWQGKEETTANQPPGESGRPKPSY